MCQFTRIPQTRSSVSFTLLNFCRCGDRDGHKAYIYEYIYINKYICTYIYIHKGSSASGMHSLDQFFFFQNKTHCNQSLLFSLIVPFQTFAFANCFQQNRAVIHDATNDQSDASLQQIFRIKRKISLQNLFDGQTG